MLKLKLIALQHPTPDSININDRNVFANTVLWLEEEKIRHYKIEDREWLRKVDDLEVWERAYGKMKLDLGMPRFESSYEELNWLLCYAVLLEFLDCANSFRDINSENVLKKQGLDLNAENFFENIDIHHKDFIDGVRRIGTLLGIEEHSGHLVQLEDIAHAIKNKMSPQIEIDTPSVQSKCPNGDNLLPDSKSEVLPSGTKKVRRREGRKKLKTAKKAIRLLNEIEDKPADLRSAEDELSLQWAKETLIANPYFTPSTSIPQEVNTANAANEQIPLKRKYSGPVRNDDVNEITGECTPKRPKHSDVANITSVLPKPKQTNSNAPKRNIKVAIVDSGNANGKITPSRWIQLESRLNKLLFQKIFNEPKGPIPTYDQSMFRGVKILNCTDEFSLEFLKKSIGEIGALWPNMSLKVIPKSQISDGPRGRVWIPAPVPNSNDILKLIKGQNEDIPCQEWRILKLDDPKPNGQNVILKLSKDSLGPLSKAGNLIYFGLGMVKVTVMRGSLKSF